jgi:hypothetical protein
MGTEFADSTGRKTGFLSDRGDLRKHGNQGSAPDGQAADKSSEPGPPAGAEDFRSRP